MIEQRPTDAFYLLIGLRRAIDHFCRALAQFAVVIHFCISQIGKGLLAQQKHRLINSSLSRRKLFKNHANILSGHGLPFF